MNLEPSHDLVLTAENKLLLLFSIIDLSPEQKDMARALIAELTNWPQFFEKAARNHALPMVVRHLRSLDIVPPDAGHWQNVQHAVQQQSVYNLLVVNALREFVTRCIQPLETKYVVFKGITLAHRYYPDIGLRPCRDIDIAVASEDLEPLIRVALREGYVLRAPNGKGGPITQERDIRALLHYARSAILISREGIAIDLQPGIDKFSGIFGEFDLATESVPMNLGGLTLPVLSDAFLLNYICHHHARHLWSRLHWISDLDAILGSPSLDRQEALALAERFGHRGTVDAALELHDLASNPGVWNALEQGQDARGAAFLWLCLANLEGDLSLEKRMSVNMIGGEFMFPWQARDDLRQRARRNWLRTMLRPSYQQYQTMPLPESLQWLYFPARLVQIGLDSVRRRAKL